MRRLQIASALAVLAVARARRTGRGDVVIGDDPEPGRRDWRARQLLTQLQRRVEIGTSSPVDLAQARLRLAEIEADLAKARLNLELIRKRLDEASRGR